MKTATSRSVWISLFLLSAATLGFEIDLTRLFSVAQFYHFAFMIVSIALLGIGASGTALAVLPWLGEGNVAQRISQLALATAASTFAAFLVTNWLPFDSFSVAWDRRQTVILLLNYVALTSPFFFSGTALGILLSRFPHAAGRTYAVNLLGSAAGCIIALAAPSWVGGEGMVMLCVTLASAAAVIPALGRRPIPWQLFPAILAVLAVAILDLGLRLSGRSPLAFLQLRISPYKGLSYALQYPGAKLVRTEWNAFSRIDVVRSEAIHSVPGLSYRYLKPLPTFDGLLVDADDLSPVGPAGMNATFSNFLPNALAFHLRPTADVLILEPRGGLDILMSFALATGSVTAIEANPLVVDAAPIYADARLTVHVETDRSFLRASSLGYDVIVISQTSSFHPVRSGAYALAEDYRYTVESFQDALARLNPGGLLIATRWLQDPPSEDLRLFALALTAIENAGGDPSSQMIAFRGFNTGTVVAKKSPFSTEELSFVRSFLAARAFDLSYAPGITADETNQYNVLPRSTYYETYLALLRNTDRATFYRDYPYDVRPPADDHPFFGHYFKWTQAPQVIAEFGKTWQPFGGAGYFVILGLLALAILLAGVLILLPVALRRKAGQSAREAYALRHLIYFGLLGFAFLFVEIPLLQHFILYVGNPAYSVTSVLFSLLFFSALGSRWSDRVPRRLTLAALVLLILALPLVLPRLFDWTLGAPVGVRLALTPLFLSPLGFLMGIPFPAGIRLMYQGRARPAETEPSGGSIPWAWAVNGAASVVASILSALLAVTFGFGWVLRLGALCYGGALITALAPSAARPQGR